MKFWKLGKINKNDDLASATIHVTLVSAIDH